MNLIKLLQTLKEKGLDEAHCELLGQAVALQEEKLTLIRTANKVLQENNDLLKDKVRRLEADIGQLRQYLISPQAVSPTSAPVGPAKHIQEISDMTVAILQECLKRDLVAFNCADMAVFLSCKKSDVETALTELVESGLIEQDRTGPEKAAFLLTAAGKSYAGTLANDTGA